MTQPKQPQAPAGSLYQNGASQILIDPNGGQTLIYEDKYQGGRVFYDQSQTSYNNFQYGGFGWFVAKEENDS